MTEPEIEEMVLCYLQDAQDEDQGIASIRRFADVGMLTRDRGLVLRMKDGSEFQISIKRSR